MHQRELLTGLI